MFQPQNKSTSRPSGPAKDQFRQFINDMIKAPTIIVVDNEGNNLGTFRRDDALRLAESKGLDLIQMRYDQPTMTSTCKLMDYGKYQYDKKKSASDAKQQATNKGMKELKMKYNIGENDLQLKVKKGIEILNDGYQLRFAIELRGREIMFKEKALEKIQKVISGIGDNGKSNGIKNEPRGYSVVFAGKKKH
ncbi:MAG TPA: translation initiation factor IF-3 [Candidatus Absconditabacterales bacterium]|nr:translation initiation factor IF-3 [Candidatus Absconditabacterales bacterium]HNG97261.1 translation initiation factor IF-3 [Candidatus Absconditabacterales bacterium]